MESGENSDNNKLGKLLRKIADALEISHMEFLRQCGYLDKYS